MDGKRQEERFEGKRKGG
jgi:hypothetical protein